MEDGACHNEHLYASVLRGARHAPRHVLRHVLRLVLHGLVPHVLVLHVSPKGRPGMGHRWQMTMGKINTFTTNNFTFPSFAAPNTSSYVLHQAHLVRPSRVT